MPIPRMNAKAVRAEVERFLTEDAPWGDITTESLVAPSTRASAVVAARESGVMCGAEVITAAFDNCDVSIEVADGDEFEAGTVLARIEGPAHNVLLAERVTLNLLQRLCATATLSRRFVSAVSHTAAAIVDTRKTTPGLRMFEKYAVRCGGAKNHRYSLSDAVLVKDNHLAAVTTAGADVTEVLAAMRDSIGHTVHIEVEVDRLDQIEAVLASGVVDTVMFDNFTLDELRSGVALVAGRARTEASGGVDLASVGAIAETGVDQISVGALTHSAGSLDIGLDLVVGQS